MPTLKAVCEGHTYPIDLFVKKVGTGEPYEFDPADTVELILKTQDGRPACDTTGNVTIIPPLTSGIVRFSPDSGDFRAKDGPYLARLKIMTATGVFFVPEDQEAMWPVRWP